MAVTRLGQYGGPKTDTYGSNNQGGLLDNCIAVFNCAFVLNSTKGTARGVSVAQSAIVGNNVFVGVKFSGVRGVLNDGISNIEALNNAAYYSGTTASSCLYQATDLGGNFVVKNSVKTTYDPSVFYMLPDLWKGEYRPSRYAEATEPVAINPAAAFPGSDMWTTDLLDRVVQDGEWCSGPVSAVFDDVTVPISAGSTADLFSGQAITVTVSVDGIMTFSAEPESQFFGRGCYVKYKSARVMSDGTVTLFSTSAVVDTRYGTSGLQWRAVSWEGGLPEPTVSIVNGVATEHISTAKAYHCITDLTTWMKDNKLAAWIGFRTTAGSLLNARVKFDIAMYNTKKYTALAIQTLPATTSKYRFRLYAPRDYHTECVQSQAADSRSAFAYGSGFKTDVRTTQGALVTVLPNMYITFDGLKFANVQLAEGEQFESAGAIIANDLSYTNVDIVGCVFTGCSCAAKMESGRAVNNIVHQPIRGFIVGGEGVVLAHNTIINPSSLGIGYAAPVERAFVTINNVVVANVGSPTCILRSINAQGFGDTCSDASGTYASGNAAPAYTDFSALFVDSSGNYMAKARSVLWNRKIVLNSHRYRAADDEARHRITCVGTHLYGYTIAPAQLPSWMLPELDTLTDMLKRDFYGRIRQSADMYCGAIEFKASDVHFSCGSVSSSITGTLEYVPMAYPSSETWMPTGLVRIKKGGYQTLTSLRTGMKVNATVNGTAAVYHLAERVTNTIWRMTTSSFANYPATSVSPVVQSIVCDISSLTPLHSTANASGPVNNLHVPADIVASNLDVSVHILSSQSPAQRVDISGVNCTAVNPFRICSVPGDIAYHRGRLTSSSSMARLVWAGAGVDDPALNFIEMHGGRVEGLRIVCNSKSTAVKFLDCMEAAFCNNVVTGAGVAVNFGGSTLRTEASNNVFSGCITGVRTATGKTAGEYPYSSFNVGPVGGDLDVIMTPAYGDLSSKGAWIFENIYRKFTFIVNSVPGASPSITNPVYNSTTGYYTITATMDPGATWLDVFNALDDSYVGIGTYAGYRRVALALTGFVAYIRPTGQQTVSASAYAGPQEVRNYVGYERHQVPQYGLVPPLPAFYTALKNSFNNDNSSTQVVHNTFIRCATAIDLPESHPDSDYGWYGRTHVMNNAFHGCRIDSSGQPRQWESNDTIQPYPYLATLSVWSGNATTNSRLKRTIGNTTMTDQRTKHTWYRPLGILGTSVIDSHSRGVAIAPFDMDCGWRHLRLYNGTATHFADMGPEDEWQTDAALIRGRIIQIPRTDITGSERDYCVGNPGAFGGAQTVAALFAEMSDTVTGDVSVDSAFEGYSVVYRLTHNASAYDFYSQTGVYDSALYDGLELPMHNMAVIAEHIMLSRFLKLAHVKVDVCETKYTTGRVSSDEDLEFRIGAEGLIAIDWNDPTSVSPSMRYTHDVGTVEPDGSTTYKWFERHKSSMQTYKPAFCGRFDLTGGELVSGFTFLIETDPDQVTEGTAIIYGNGMVPASAYTPDMFEDPVIHCNEHGKRWSSDFIDPEYGNIGTPNTGMFGSFAPTTFAHLLSVNSLNGFKVIIRNIRAAVTDPWPFHDSLSTLLVSGGPSLLYLEGASDVEIYNCELMYNYRLMNIDSFLPSGMAGLNLRTVTIINNAIAQLDYAGLKTGPASSGEIVTENGVSTVAMLPVWKTTPSWYGEYIHSVPLKNVDGTYVKYVFANNDIMAYNAGGPVDGSTRFEFIQGVQCSDPVGFMYSPKITSPSDTHGIIQYGNRMIHPFHSYSDLGHYRFGDSVVSYGGHNLDSSNGTLEVSTLNAEVFGEVTETDPHDAATDERINIIGCEVYRTGQFFDQLVNPTKGIDFAFSQKYATSAAMPTTVSTAALAGYGPSQLPAAWNSLTESVSTDIVGRPRFHSNEIVDIGAYYITSLRSTFGRDNIIDIKQVFLSPMSGVDHYRIDGTNDIFQPKVTPSASDYCNGARMLFRMARDVSTFAAVTDKPMDIVAVFPDTLFDDTAFAMLMPMSGYVDVSMTRPLSGALLDSVFSALMSGRYILGYDYSKSIATVYVNPIYGLGCTGVNSVVDQVRYSENRMMP